MRPPPHTHGPPPSLVMSQHLARIISQHLPAPPDRSNTPHTPTANLDTVIVCQMTMPCHSTKKYKKGKYRLLDPFTVTTTPPALSLLTATTATASRHNVHSNGDHGTLMVPACATRCDNNGEDSATSTAPLCPCTRLGRSDSTT